MAQKSKLLLAAELLKIKAVKLQPEQPFTWASGWKSPFYCDTRKTLSFPGLRTRVKLGLSNLILEEFPEADTVAGVATGAIAQGALVAEELGKPVGSDTENGKATFVTLFGLDMAKKQAKELTEKAEKLIVDNFSEEAADFLAATAWWLYNRKS